MSDPPQKKKIKKLTIDTKNYVSGGRGVSTLDLIRNPRANDAVWATLDEDLENLKKREPKPLKDLSALKRKKHPGAAPQKAAPPPIDTQKPLELATHLKLNLINSRAAKHQETYIKRIQIEKYLLAGIENVDVLNDPDLLNHYQNNKTVVKRQINKTTKDICKIIVNRYPEMIDMILSHEAFILDSVEMILNTKLSGSTQTEEDIKEMALSCVNIVKSKMG